MEIVQLRTTMHNCKQSPRDHSDSSEWCNVRGWIPLKNAHRIAREFLSVKVKNINTFLMILISITSDVNEVLNHQSHECPGLACWQACFTKNSNMYPWLHVLSIFASTGQVDDGVSLQSSGISVCHYPYKADKQKRSLFLSSVDDNTNLKSVLHIILLHMGGVYDHFCMHSDLPWGGITLSLNNLTDLSDLISMWHLLG